MYFPVVCPFGLSSVFPFVFSYVGTGQVGQGELPRATYGLPEVGADGERGRTLHNIAMIRQGPMRLMKHYY